MFGVKLYPDKTGCVHDLMVIMGVYQCRRCNRIFETIETESGPRLRAQESRIAP